MLDPYWTKEISRSHTRRAALMSGPNSAFYRTWAETGSPNALREGKEAKVMKFPKTIRRVPRPKQTMHRGATWDYCEVILPDGRQVDGRMDYTWGRNFYFELDSDWRRGSIGAFETKSNGATCVLDLRDRRKLAEAKALVDEYAALLASSEATDEQIEAMGARVERAASAAGYNDHQRLAALHTQAEQRSLA